MAAYFPTGSWERAVDTCHIVRAEEKDGYTRYVIEIHLPPYKWHVYRRYRQFVELHEKIYASLKKFKKNLQM